MMGINDFLSIAIVGGALSVIIEIITNKYGTDTNTSKAVALVLSVVVGGLYWYLSQLSIWESILGVLAAASTVYALFFRGNK